VSRGGSESVRLLDSTACRGCEGVESYCHHIVSLRNLRARGRVPGVAPHSEVGPSKPGPTGAVSGPVSYLLRGRCPLPALGRIDEPGSRSRAAHRRCRRLDCRDRLATGRAACHAHSSGLCRCPWARLAFRDLAMTRNGALANLFRCAARARCHTSSGTSAGFMRFHGYGKRTDASGGSGARRSGVWDGRGTGNARWWTRRGRAADLGPPLDLPIPKRTCRSGARIARPHCRPVESWNAHLLGDQPRAGLNCWPTSWDTQCAGCIITGDEW
jgi:hypothetical protein